MLLTGTAAFFRSWLLRESEDINLFSDSFKMLLVGSDYVVDLNNHSVLADISNEVSGGGYQRQALGGVTWNDISGSPRFSFDELTFAATTGAWSARRWVLWDDTPGDKPLLATGLISSLDEDVTITAGNTLTFTLPAGYFFERGDE